MPTQGVQPDPPLKRMAAIVVFAARWMLAPICLGLAASLIIILIRFAMDFYELAEHAAQSSVDQTIIGILSLVDLGLMSGLVIMVMLATYETFVARLDVMEHHERPDWMGQVGFSELKLKVIASVVAIATIHLLEDFMNIDHVDNRELGWSIGIQMTIVVSGLLLALMDRLASDGH